MAKPVLGPRELLAVVIIMFVVFAVALVSLNTQRPVSLKSDPTAAKVSTATAEEIASKVEKSLGGEQVSYRDTTCPNYYPASYPAVLTCSSIEDGKPVVIDVHMESKTDLVPKVLRAQG